MVRRKTIKMLGTMLFLTAFCDVGAMAQQVLVLTKSTTAKQVRLSPEEMMQKEKKLMLQYPLLFTRTLARSSAVLSGGLLNNEDKHVAEPLSKAVPFSKATATDGRELWGNVITDNTWASGSKQYGIYKFKTAGQQISVSPLYLNNNLLSNGAGAIVGNRIDLINYDTSFGMVFTQHYQFDAETWEQIGTGDVLNDMSLIGFETAVAEDGTVYGEFMSSDGKKLELGIVDYATLSRTTIGELSRKYVAMGITKSNVLYGIAADGNLYRIDTATAAETLVGPTGVTVSNSDGNFYYQSGEIDQTNDTFYWAAMDINQHSSLYNVNLTTGAATKIADFANNNTVNMLTIPQKTIADDAPAPISDLTVDFPNGSLSGHINFKTPSVTEGGGELTGKLVYVITANKDTVATGTAQPNTGMSVAVTVKNGGTVRFVVTTSNDAGVSAIVKTDAFIGHDTPKSTDGVVLEVDKATGMAKVSWNAVEKGVNGGYMGDVCYDVVRYPDGKKIVESTKELSCTDKLEKGELKAYCYGVTVKNGEQKSSEVRSNFVAYGDALNLPYSESFDNSSSMGLFTVLDCNNDNSTWTYTPDSNPAVSYVYSKTNKADDWLITPPMKVEKGKVYHVSFNYKNSGYTERMEVKYGSGATVESMSGDIMPATDINNSEYANYKKDITVQEDGMLYIGFHAISDADNYRLYVDDISVSAGAVSNAPDSVTQLKVVPGKNGALSATVSFVAPTKTFNGEQLDGKMTIKVSRDNAVIKTFENVAPGEAKTFVDSPVPEGNATYRVLASNDAGDGRTSGAVVVYVGNDVPYRPLNLCAADNTTSFHLSWNSVDTGKNGGYVNSNNVYYKIYNIAEPWSGYYTYEVADSTAVGNTSYDMAYNCDEGEQKRVRFGVSAKNDKGESSISLTPDLIVGKPYEMPFFESMKEGKLNNTLWVVTATGSSTFSIDKTGVSSDADGGCLKYYSVNDNDIATLNSGKIKMAGTSDAQLIFSHKARIGSNSMIKVWAQKPDGTRLQLDSIKYSELTGQGSPWTRTAIKVKPELQTLPYVIIGFDVSAPEWEKIYLDDFCFRDVKDNDLTIRDFTVPSSMKKGSKAEASLKVANFGKNTAEAFQLNLYANGTLVDSKIEEKPLEPLAERTYVLNYKNDVFSSAADVKLKAEIVYSSDQYLVDNEKVAEVTIGDSHKPKPESVTADNTESGVKVEWTAVDASSKSIDESFEDYASWTTDNFGDWTSSYDFKGETAGLFQQFTYPHQGEKFAYILVDPLNNWLTEETLKYNKNLYAHTGNKYLAAFYSYVDGQIVDADNWLYSPVLSGEKQTISFWANNSKAGDTVYPETFDVLYSTDEGTDHKKYVKIGETNTISACNWTNFSFELPEGARRFAIHNNTYRSDNYVFMLDDVSYRIGFGTLVGYNVYRDGKLLASVQADDTQYIDNSIEQGNTYTYAVTALFADGESDAVTAIPVIVSSIDNIGADLKYSSRMYTIDGKQIRNSSLYKNGVVIRNNKKVLVK